MQKLKNNQANALRLDRFLMQELGLSRREVLLLLEHKLVTSKGSKLSTKHKGMLLLPEASIDIANFDTLLSGKILREAYPLDVLAQGDGYLIINKPAGMPVMPLQSNETGTVLNALVARYPDMQGIGEGGLRSGVVHRLDTDTSGTLMIATKEQTWQHLRAAFKNHQTQKHYRALVQGQPEAQGYEQMFLYVAQHKPAKVRVSENQNKNTRACTLSWTRLETFEHSSLLEIKLETGFLHQIRVMFAHKDHPILGDKLYGENVAKLAPRQMLHASYLKVQDIEAHSPDPEDFSNLLELLRN